MPKPSSHIAPEAETTTTIRRIGTGAVLPLTKAMLGPLGLEIGRAAPVPVKDGVLAMAAAAARGPRRSRRASAPAARAGRTGHRRRCAPASSGAAGGGGGHGEDAVLHRDGRRPPDLEPERAEHGLRQRQDGAGPDPADRGGRLGLRGDVGGWFWHRLMTG